MQLLFFLIIKLIDQIFLHAQIVDYKSLSIRCILTHIELQQVEYLVVFGEAHGVQAHILANEVLKLVGRNLSKTFKTGYFWIWAKALDGLLALLGRIAIDGLFLVAHAEERRL